MPYDPQKAATYNQAIAQGLSEDQAFAAAGITEEESLDYIIDNVGSPDPDSASYNPNYGQLEPQGFDRPVSAVQEQTTQLTAAEADEDPTLPDPPAPSRTDVTTQFTTTTQETVTGGNVTTTSYVPVQYTDTTESIAFQLEADQLYAQKSARAAELKAQGKTGGEILRDPEYRRLSNEAGVAEYKSQNAKVPVQAGAVDTYIEPGPGENTSEPTIDQDYLVNYSSDEDPEVELQEISRTPPTGSQLVDANEPFSPDVSPYGEENDPFEGPPLEDPPLDEFEDDQDLLAQERLAEAQFVERFEPDPVDYDDDPFAPENDDPFDPDTNELRPGYDFDGFGNPVYVGSNARSLGNTFETDEAASAQATLDLARQQQAIAVARKQSNTTDWRVRLSLAPNAQYLYKDPSITQEGILYPLLTTDGILFPYTPQIQTNYNASYSSYDLTHSNFRGRFYQSSNVGDILMNATFTAQDTSEANYLLAVIHFLRSCTKMFYGANDAFAGAPPPVVYLRGFGPYQFNDHPCVVSQFNYNLPNDVDYIRARSVNIDGTNLLKRRDRQQVASNIFSSAARRLSSVGLKKGAVPSDPAVPTLGTADSTYVPTKIDLSITLLPIQSREQVSKQFNMKQFANGDLLRGGFW